MSVDLIDRAFLSRLAAPVATDTPAEAPALAGSVDEAPLQCDPVVSLLLATCPEQWERLADHVEAAWQAGERVVAVAGRTRGDGVSTVVQGLACVLRGRGVALTCCEQRRHREGGAFDPAHGDGAVLVDGGAWFPIGPVHRGRLARAAFGCHAAILVRRADRSPCPPHAAALATLGIHVLGEVVTFADAPPGLTAVESA